MGEKYYHVALEQFQMGTLFASKKILTLGQLLERQNGKMGNLLDIMYLNLSSRSFLVVCNPSTMKNFQTSQRSF